MQFEELERQVGKLKPHLSAEGLMLVELFMPFCRELQEENKQLKAENKRLRDQLSQNSRNSSRPPSTDYGRPQKRNVSTGTPKRKAGGQQGHEGHGNELHEDPDNIISYSLSDCPACGQDLSGVPADAVLRKQVEDIPLIQTTVTEHQIEVKTCPACGEQWQAGGCEVQHRFEYGPHVKALAVYLSAYQFIPQKRVQDLFGLWGINLSTGTLNNFRQAAARRVAPFMESLRQRLIAAPSAHFDETGLKVGGSNYWVHVASTQTLSFFGIHPNRGRKAHQAMGILPQFSGIAHRDAYRSYDEYSQSCGSLCCAHILRELQFAVECDKQQLWAQSMTELLLSIKKQVEARPDSIVDLRWQGRYRKQYRALIRQGLILNPAVKRPEGQISGLTKQSKTYNLLIRLREREQEVLRFMTEPLAEFTNNQAERDLRMNKVRAKVSGGFRARKAAEEFMHIRSLISTAVKQALCPLKTLIQVFTPENREFMNMLNPD